MTCAKDPFPEMSRRSALKLATGGALRAMLASPAIIAPAIANAAELDKAIGKLIMIGFSGKGARGDFAQKIASQIRRGRASSVIFLSTNIGSRNDITGLTRLFHGAGATHIAIDHEGGTVQRLKKAQGFTTIPSALNIARKRSPQEAEKIYSVAAKELFKAGFSLNLGPVVDLHRDYNPVIGRNRRAYSTKATVVSQYAAAFIRAHHKYGVKTAIKHFPGHGLSKADSHKGFVDVRKTWQAEELQPFQQLIRQNIVDIVMAGHLYVPVGNGKGELTTFSRTIIQGVLRQNLGFGGLAMTDDLDMRAVRDIASQKESVLRALEAGYDLLLLSNTLGPNPDLPAEAAGWIKSAIKQGRLSENSILASAKRLDISKRA